jgi:hypothetical protein
MMRHSPLLIPLFLFATVSGESQTNALPQIRQNGAVKQLFVDNKPFIMLAGELHNSSASSVEYMKPIWDKLASMHLNTVIGTASWELVEPEEGKFDFSLVDAQIGEARRRNMRLVLIWFADLEECRFEPRASLGKGGPEAIPTLGYQGAPERGNGVVPCHLHVTAGHCSAQSAWQ